MRAWGVVGLVLCACGGGGGSGGGGGGGGGGGPDAGDGSGSDTAALNACVTQTNTYRSMDGKSALTESSALEQYAAVGAMYDFTNGAHAHFEATDGGGIAFAENECPQQGNWTLSIGNGDLTQTVLACLQAFYDEGPGSDYSTHGHYINMMGPYGSLGCGVYIQGQQLTIVQDYGM